MFYMNRTTSMPMSVFSVMMWIRIYSRSGVLSLHNLLTLKHCFISKKVSKISVVCATHDIIHAKGLNQGYLSPLNPCYSHLC